MRILLVLLACVSLLLGLSWLATRDEGTRGARGATARAADPVSPVPDVAERPPAPVEESRHDLHEAEPEPSSPQAGVFPRSRLAGGVFWVGGDPAVNVEVEIRAEDQRGTARPLASLRTGENGSFAAVVPGRGPFAVRASAGKLVEAVRSARAGSERILLTLPRGGHLQGRVSDDTGAPVHEFTLQLNGQGGESRSTVRSEDGTFDLEVEVGSWELTVAAVGHGTWSRRNVKVPPASPLEIRLARLARLRGVVRDAAGAAAMGVDVLLWNTEASTRSQADGAFELECPPGAQVLFARDLFGERRSEVRLQVVPGEVREGLLLRVPLTGTVLGRVTGLGGVPAPGREVLLLPDRDQTEVTGWRCFTDEVGAFFARLPPGSWHAQVPLGSAEIRAWEQAGVLREAGSEPPFVSEPFQLVGHERTQIAVSLAPLPVLVRGLLQRGGEPTGGGSLTAIDQLNGMTYEARVSGTAYALDLARPGRYWFVLTFGRTQRRFEIEVPAVGADALDLDLPLGWITGQVFTRDGLPAEGVRVLAEAEACLEGTSGSGFAVTEPDGSFELGLVPGNYTLSIDEEVDRNLGWNRIQGFHVREGDRRTGLRLLTMGRATDGSVCVELSTPGGARIDGARISLSPLPRRGEEPREQPATDGEATFPGLAAGTYQVKAEAPGHVLAEPLTVVVGRGGSPRVRLVLVRLRPVRVHFAGAGGDGRPRDLDAVDPTGRVVPALRLAPDEAPVGTTGFHFPGLPPGLHLVRAFTASGAVEIEVEVADAGEEPFVLELPWNP